MGKEIFVCIAELAWSQSGLPEKGDRYFYYINDGKNIQHVNRECITIKELAEGLHKGRWLSGPLSPEDNIVYEPPVPSETIYIDGYFGRPLVPVSYYNYKPLKEKQIKQLEKRLKRLRRSGTLS